MALYSFTKQERLSGKKEIDKLFNSTHTFKKDIFKVIYFDEIKVDNPEIKILISVPKKNFKSAVKRNTIKRRIRECYRKNKLSLLDFVTKNNISVHFAVIYLSAEILPYSRIEEKIIETIQQLQNVLAKNNSK